ncbi:piggyBac transposable element-derived protein 4-like [Xyrichtys novacula]|uniref:PiggyBac transposable element-derived protein 4-like n=1 Tax=Xyrichtys novacula TaxID=13765 RepID=A0AAV1HG58_XYRNO|nr:piggyBac transposable element-derived protein 4-like [Xyrichtys novacula]
MDPTFNPPNDGNEVESDGSGSNGEDSHEEMESRIQEVEDAFLYFLSEETLNKIAGYTNLEGYRRYHNWHPTDTVEIKALVGVQLLAGVFRSREGEEHISPLNQAPGWSHGLDPLYKLAIITEYNKSKGAVDTLDQLVGTYTSCRKSNRWPMAVWGNILDISAYNALVFWLDIDPRWEQGKLHRRWLFLEQLGTALVREQIARRSRVPRAPNSAAIVLSTREAAGQS